MKTIKAFTKSILLLVVFVATSCKQDDAVVPQTPVTPDPVLELAVISTDEVKIFSRTTATITGKVVSDGNSSITEKGFCFGTTTGPTITGNKVASGAGKEGFTANITGLTLNTTYYVRTYAINSKGTSYGNEVVLKTSGIDIYLAGGIDNDAGYWKNGVYTALTTTNTGSFATTITVLNNDVYAAGYDGARLVSWKNGVMTPVTDGTNSNVTAVDLVVSGSDVYVGGWEIKPNARQVAKYWKNGTEFKLTDGTNDAGVSAMFLSGTDVYAVGYEATNGIVVAKYWKNGTAVAVTDGTRHAYASSIFVDGDDVYVGGYERTDDGQSIIAKYWKNGVETALTDPTWFTVVTDIFVKDDVVYTTGFNYSSDYTDGKSLLWENTNMTVLPYDITIGYGQGRKVYVSGSDVYVYGINGGQTIIWKNGSKMEPYDGTFSTTNLVADMFIADN